MSDAVRAAFDLPAEPPHRGLRLRGRFRDAPLVLRAGTPAEVAGVVEAAEAAARAGRWVVGGLSYAAAGTWDAAQRAVRDDTTPAAHFEVYPGDPEPWPEEDAALPALDWRPDLELAGGRAPEQAITEVIEHIAAGDCYQVNLTTRWRAVARDADLHDYFLGLAAAQPGGYAVFCAGAGVASVSPELFFARTGDQVVTQPMKGTAAADAGPAVLASAKERAENLMIVDLLRNDLGRVCRTGTVGVDRLFEVHRLPTVWQLTSTVSGRALPGARLADVFAALFPCGSVTGAPKLAAMRVISELEAGPRGWYCGAFGVIRPGGDAVFNVPIRTVTASADGLTCGVGSGIVSDSEPAGEVAEWRAKARFLGGVPLGGLETMLLADGQIPRRTAHLDRLAATCAAHRLPFERGEAEALLDRAAAASPRGRHRLRLVAGIEGCDLTMGPAPGAGASMRLRLASEPLDADGPLGPVIRHKSTHRAHYDRLRLAAGADIDDVVCHNARGELTECTLGNLALLLDGEWCTPPEPSGLLPGTLRAELLASGRLRERRLLVGDLDRAEGIVFLNSLRGWCPARLA